MKKPIPYILFSRPVSRRTFFWLAVLCPGIALWIYLSARSRGAEFTVTSGGAAESSVR